MAQYDDPNGNTPGDWFDSNTPSTPNAGWADQIKGWYEKYLGRTPSQSEIQIHMGNPGGLTAIQAVIQKAAGTPAEPNTPKPGGGSGNPMDRAWVGEQVKAAFQKGYGRAPTQSEVDYWVDKALTPDEYSDGYTRQGWNPYWEDRILKRGGDSDPRLAGDAGIMRDVPRWKSGGGGGTTINPNANSYDPATFGSLNKPFGETFKYGDWGGYAPFTAPDDTTMPDFNPTVPTVNSLQMPNAPEYERYQNPMGGFSFGGYGSGASLAQVGGAGVSRLGGGVGGPTRAGGQMMAPSQGAQRQINQNGEQQTDRMDPRSVQAEIAYYQKGLADPNQPPEIKAQIQQRLGQLQAGDPMATGNRISPQGGPTNGVDQREIAPPAFQYDDYNDPTGNFGFDRAEPGALQFQSYQDPQGAFEFNRAEPGAFKYDDYKQPEDFRAPTENDLLQDPSYRVRLQEGLGAVESSAAARGNMMTGGALKALTKYGQDQASKEYAAVYGRNFNTWGANADQSKQAYDRNYGKALTEYQTAEDAYRNRFDQQARGYGINANQYNTAYNANAVKTQAEYDAAVAARNTAYDQSADTWGKNRGAYNTRWNANLGKNLTQYDAAADAQRTLYDQKMGVYNTNASQYDTAYNANRQNTDNRYASEVDKAKSQWNSQKDLSDTAYNQQTGTYGINAANKAGRYQNAYNQWNTANANKKDDWQTNYNKASDAYKMRYDIWNSQNNTQFDRLYRLSSLGQGSW